MTKRVLIRIVTKDVIKVAGCLQLFPRQEAGSEAAIHTMHEIFENNKTKTVLLVNAENAFNTNRKE